MNDLLLANEPLIRLGFFTGILVAMAAWEVAAPRRGQAISRLVRWPSNLGIVVLNTVVARLAFPTAAVAVAAIAAERGWGLLNMLAVPWWASLVIAVVALDLVIYFQHVLLHAVPALWRLHRMHHADLEFDVTTGLRFHPLEIVLSMAIKLATVIALGPPAVAVLIFEVVLNGSSMFNHGDVRIAAGLDRVLRWFVVTPDMHRVHHSVRPDETNSNFGFNLPWWDRMFGTYRAQPAAGHVDMTIGIEQFRRPRDLWLDHMLVQPLLGTASGYPINRASRGESEGSRSMPDGFAEE